MNDGLIIDQAADVSHVAPDERPANDLRHAMMTLPVASQNQMLTEYKARRDNFRQWLMSQLVEGVHYGIVPGCEPKTKEIDGVIHYGVWVKGKDGAKGGYQWYPPSQWTPKPSLYAAGADFICDILGVRDEYVTDAVGWQQMGSKSGTCVVRCRLFSRASNDLMGESLGAYSHQYDANNAVKMASKCAKVGAVINAYGLRDLFTQDEPTGPPNENPIEDESAPKATPRAKRDDAKAWAERIGNIVAIWKAKNPNPQGDVAAWSSDYKKWVMATCDRVFNPQKPLEWTADDAFKCERALNIESEAG